MLRSAIVAISTLAFALSISTSTVQARNTPCSQAKGGVKAYQGNKYLCNDGSVSSSKTKCSRS